MGIGPGGGTVSLTRGIGAACFRCRSTKLDTLDRYIAIIGAEKCRASSKVCSYPPKPQIPSSYRLITDELQQQLLTNTHDGLLLHGLFHELVDLVVRLSHDLVVSLEPGDGQRLPVGLIREQRQSGFPKASPGLKIKKQKHKGW